MICRGITYLSRNHTKSVAYCLAIFCLLFTQHSANGFEDDDGCLVCHKYPLMGRISEDGVRRSYYVMPHVYKDTVHRNVSCPDCHKEIEQLPHEPITTGVTCDSECHSVINPATGNNFSHKPIVDVYMTSTHGRSKVPEQTDADKPYCIACHTNPIYDPVELKPPREITDRCVVCHEDQEFVENWYKHTSRRIREVKRQPQEILELCTGCHMDQDFISRRMELAASEGRELGRKFPKAVESYEKSFHGKVNHFGLSDAANCLDCHVDNDNYYLFVHNILPSRSVDSPTHPSNRMATCKRCHLYANSNYATIDPHPTGDLEDNPFRYYAEKTYGIIGDFILIALVSLALLETFRRRQEGASWRLRGGSSWNRKRSGQKKDRHQSK